MRTTAITLLLLSGPLLAQTPASAPAEEDAYKPGEIIELGDGSRYQVDEDGDLVPLMDEAEAVVVTGTRVKELAEKGAVKVDVISRDEIVERGRANLADVLEEEAGIQTTSSQGTGKDIIIDGMDGKYVLVMIDGRPVYGRVNSRLDFTRVAINPESVERIEVVRGPMSALYGSEALGGVINIITRKPEQPVEASMRLSTNLFPEDLKLPGTPYENDAYGHVSGRWRNLAATLDLTGAWARSYDQDQDGKTDAPGRSEGALSSRVEAGLGRDMVAVATATGSLNTRQGKVSADAPFGERLIDRLAGLGLELDQGLGADHNLRARLNVDQFYHELFRVTSLEGGVRANPRTRINQQQLTSELQYQAPVLRRLPFAHRLDLIAGVSGAAEEVDRRDQDGNDTLWGNHGRTMGAVFGEVYYQPWDFLTLIPGGRFDAVTGMLEAAGGFDAEGYPIDLRQKTELNFGPKLSLRLDGPWGLALRASYGEGFRTPTFLERFLIMDHSEQGFFILGNPYLEPEKSRGFRIGGVAKPNSRFGAEVEYFINLFDNLIDYAYQGTTDDGLGLYQSVNWPHGYTSGINLSGHARRIAGSVDLSASYQYLINAVNSSFCPDDDPYFCDKGYSLPLRPAHSAHFKLSWRAPEKYGTRLFGTADLVSDRPYFDEDEDGVDDQLPGYALFSIGARQRVGANTELHATVHNLTNAYHPIHGPKPGRTFELGLSVHY